MSFHFLALSLPTPPPHPFLFGINIELQLNFPLILSELSKAKRLNIGSVFPSREALAALTWHYEA